MSGLNFQHDERNLAKEPVLDLSPIDSRLRNEIEHVFSGYAGKVLSAYANLYFDPSERKEDKAYSVWELAAIARLSPGIVAREVSRLEEKGIFKGKKDTPKEYMGEKFNSRRYYMDKETAEAFCDAMFVKTGDSRFAEFKKIVNRTE